MNSIPNSVDKKTAENAIEQFSQYAGATVNIEFHYYSGENLVPFNTNGYVLFRTPESYGHYGMVIKGNDYHIATLLKVEDGLVFEIYNQLKKETIETGTVVNLNIEFEILSSDSKLELKKYILDSSSLR